MCFQELGSVLRMTATMDVNHIKSCIDGGLYFLVEEIETTKKKVWQRFYRVVSRDTGNIVTDTTSCRGYAACRKCREICRLGPKGGTTELEKHLVLCSQAVTVDDTALRYSFIFFPIFFSPVS